MTSFHLVQSISLAFAAAGIIAFLVGATATRNLRTAVLMMLDLWTAGGLLRLSGDPAWSSIVTVALTVGVRKLVGSGYKIAAVS